MISINDGQLGESGILHRQLVTLLQSVTVLGILYLAWPFPGVGTGSEGISVGESCSLSSLNGRREMFLGQMCLCSINWCIFQRHPQVQVGVRLLRATRWMRIRPSRNGGRGGGGAESEGAYLLTSP